MIQYIFFDIDDTLFPTSEFAQLARKNAIRAMIEIGLPFNNSDREATLRETCSAEQAEELYNKLLRIIDRLGSNSDQHFNELLKELNVQRPERFIAAAVAAYHNTKTSILPYPEVPRVLLALREQGYKLYIATNGNTVKQWDKLIRLGIALYFEDVFVSEEIGKEKSKEFFDRVLASLKIKAGDCIMIGDKEDKDIIPAKEAGMHAIKRGNNGISDFTHLLDIIKKL